MSNVMLGSMTYDEVYKTHYDRILNYICKMTYDYERSLDLTQEVFLRVLANASKYREENKLITWLYTIAYNLCISDYKHRKQEEKYVSYIDNMSGRGIMDPNTSQEMIIINNIIDELPTERAEAIRMYAYDAMSYEEIATASGVALGTVKSRICRAREEIKDRYAKISGG